MKNNFPKKILIHCSDISYVDYPDQFDMVNAYHRDDRGFNRSTLGIFVGYHRLITGGKNYVCRDNREHGNHCNKIVDGISMNFQSLGVGVGFDGDIQFPKLDEYHLLKKQVHEWQEAFNIPNSEVYFHRQFDSNKTCPGHLIDSEWLADLLRRYPQPVKPPEQLEKKELIELQKKVSLLTQLVELLKQLLSLKKRLGSMENYPQWYVSTQGPQIATTVKGLAGLLVPVIKQLLGIEFENQILDNIIDASLILGFALWALVGYLKAKKTLGARIENLSRQVENLGGTPQ